MAPHEYHYSLLPPQISDINTETLFGNIAEVTRLSGDFLTSLEESSRNEEAVGGVFMSYSSRLREVYAGYCRNHDSAAAMLEKVCTCRQK